MAEPVNVVLSLHLNLIGIAGSLVVLIGAGLVAAFLNHLDKKERKS